MFKFQDKEAGGKGEAAGKPETKINIEDILYLKEQAAALNTNLFGIYDSFLKSFQTLDQYSASFAKTFGGVTNFSLAIKQNLQEAAPGVIELGGSMEQVQKMQLEVNKQLGTQTLINADSFAELYANTSLVSEAGADIGARTGEVVKKFADAGYGIQSTSKEMLGVINNAKELGVATAAVFKQVEANMAKLNSFNFSDGIQGMAKMAANAALLRIDMNTTLGLADRLFDPEQAIEMAAGFQRLGVGVTDLLDPYRLMDMARNDPEKLQESIGQALSKFTEFDEKTGRMRIMSGAMGQVRELAKQMNVPLETITQWGVAYGDVARKMKEIPFSPEFDTNENDRKMIAGMAQLATSGEFKGQYVVSLQNETGGTEQKLVSELTEEDRQRIEEANKPAKSGIELQQASLSELTRIYNLLQAQKDVLALGLVANRGVDDGMKKLLSAYATGAKIQGELVGLDRKKVGEKGTIFTGEGMRMGVDDFLKSEGAQKLIEQVRSGDFKGMYETMSEMGGKMYEKKKEKLLGKEGEKGSIEETLLGEGFKPEEIESLKNGTLAVVDFVKTNMSSLTTNFDAMKQKATELVPSLTAVTSAFESMRTFLSENKLNPLAMSATPPEGSTQTLSSLVQQQIQNLANQTSVNPPTATNTTLSNNAVNPPVNSVNQPYTINNIPVSQLSSSDIESMVSKKFYGENINKNIEEKKTTLDLNVTANPPSLKQDMLNAIFMDPQLRELLVNTIKESTVEEAKKAGGKVPK